MFFLIDAACVQNCNLPIFSLLLFFYTVLAVYYFI